MVSGQLKGVIAAIATPVTQAGEPDHARFLRLARHLLDNGCDGLNVLGTTGEATSFSREQRMALMSAVAASDLPTSRLMVGTGAAAVTDATRLARHAAQLGFAGALVLPPFYYKGVGADGVVRYIEAVAAASDDIPLYLYHFPALSGVPYEIALVARLRQTFGARIAGLKDSSGDMAYARAIAALDPGLSVFPSNEACLLEARGGAFAGCISATANLNSDLCARAWRDGNEGALADAVAIRKLFDGKPLVPGVKALLAHLHRDEALSQVLPPMMPAPEADARAAAEAHARIRSSALMPA